MRATVPSCERDQPGWILTLHASERMRSRGLRVDAIAAAMQHGRVIHIRGADIRAIGRSEVQWGRRYGIDLSCYQGVQVVCGSDGAVLTAYRNSDFRSLRARHRRAHRRRW